MAGTTLTPYMFLPNPIPGVEVGPEWSYDINACLSIVDQHNHSSGQGQQIQPNGLNINSDLPFGGNNATLLRTARFSSQAAPITNASPDVGALYVSGNELYFNDVSGSHQVQITNNGNVNAGAGSITGLPSGTASATFSAGTFVWQSATSTAANMDARSYVFRNSGASSFGLTLSAPVLGADTALTLPAVPGAQSFVTLDASGNFGTPVALSGGLTASNLSASAGIAGTQLSASANIVGTQLNAAAGILSTQLASPALNTTAVGALSLTTTTTIISGGGGGTAGRPFFVYFVSNATASGGIIVPAGWSVTFIISHNLTTFNSSTIDNTGGSSSISLPISALNCFGASYGSGSTFVFRMNVNTAAAGSVTISAFTLNSFVM